MRPFHLLIAGLPAVVIATFCLPASAHADSLSCTSINGATRCIGSDGLDCRSEDGRMVCAPGAKGSCEIVGGMVMCNNGGVSQSFRIAPSHRRAPDDDASKRSPSTE